MSPPSLRRSPILWLGLFGCLFILWAWVDSNRYSTYAETYLIDRNIAVGHARNLVGLVITEGRMASTRTSFDRQPSGITRNFDLLARPIYNNDSVSDYFGNKGSQRTIGIPYWMILLIYLWLWSIPLRWRAKRLRTLKQQDDPPPQAAS